MADIPGWLIYVLGIITGALVMLAIGPASDAFWEAVYWVRRICLIIGACVIAAALLAGGIYLVLQSQTS